MEAQLALHRSTLGRATEIPVGKCTALKISKVMQSCHEQACF